jgi:hypothetical protein
MFLSLSSSLKPLRMITFSKNAYCPASQDLLAFQKGETSAEENTGIQRHLGSCEFCAAEVDLYARCPLSEEPAVSTDIPIPLYQLAEALLGNQRKKFSLLNELFYEGKGLSLNKI